MKRVVLVRTAGPRNVGSVLRAAANFGPAEVWLVAPQRPSLLIHPEFEQMSHGVEDAAKRVQVVDTLQEALADRTHAIGFTARHHHHRVIEPFDRAADGIAERSADPDQRLALVFGSEESGLAGDETEQCHELCYLATSEEHGSLNLSMAVTVVLFGLFRPGQLASKTSRIAHLTGAERHYLVENVAATLSDAALSDAAARDILASVRRVLGRAPIESRDARAWHQIMRALGSHRTPADVGAAPDSDREAPGD
ncbi:tRNA (cytidine/uridine-2'-O-)-methyltransferase TrmJ [Planctomycetes bacterium Pla163]|uniref:tRNA (Cytidine/uridine-2'-O-)-methyltransferase TrmJ n=1 Tax=Rohdeia mirabilis TaxID=2528008 RepID=A0A518CWJ2_9BACT|nr:tRNA (cytidine/uridine-2'-O-)-methyltransferase TrmJ [Planctomycetes bacterium Pla163]